MEIPRDKLDLRDDPGVLSAPIVDPAWQCSSVVAVHGYVPEAKLDLELDGVVVITGAPGGFPLPDGAVLTLAAPLTAGQVMRARQKFGGATSPWSAVVTVGDHTIDFPQGRRGRRSIPAPVYACGVRTGVGNLLVGSNVWITADGIEVGRKDGAASQQGVNVAPPYLPRTVGPGVVVALQGSEPTLGHADCAVVAQSPPRAGIPARIRRRPAADDHQRGQRRAHHAEPQRHRAVHVSVVGLPAHRRADAAVHDGRDVLRHAAAVSRRSSEQQRNHDDLAVLLLAGARRRTRPGRRHERNADIVRPGRADQGVRERRQARRWKRPRGDLATAGGRRRYGSRRPGPGRSASVTWRRS